MDIIIEVGGELLKLYVVREVYICDSGISTIFRFSDRERKIDGERGLLRLKRKQNERPGLEIYHYRASKGKWISS